MTLPRIAPIKRSALAAAVAMLDLSPRDDAIAELEQDERDRERRRIERQARGGSAGRLRCGGCRRWLIATNEHCKNCGFVNDIRGRRNHGGY